MKLVFVFSVCSMGLCYGCDFVLWISKGWLIWFGVSCHRPNLGGLAWGCIYVGFVIYVVRLVGFVVRGVLFCFVRWLFYGLMV